MQIQSINVFVFDDLVKKLDTLLQHLNLIIIFQKIPIQSVYLHIFLRYAEIT